MKKSLSLLFAFALATAVWAQAPQRINYQAILRDASGTIQANTAATLGIAVLQGSSSGTVVYNENHAVTTNTFGLANVAIGGGTVVSGSFASIDWSNGPWFVRTSVNGTPMGTTQLMSVPYALFAETSNTPGPIGPAGPPGPQGVAGATGATGPAGATGPTGATGAQGPQGPQGAQGPAGPQGPAGADGTGVTILGSLTNVNQLPGAGDPGDAYLVNGSLYVWSNNTNTWENVGSIQGPTGPQGPAGQQGATGPAGATGATGATGPAGQQGATGATGATGAAGADGRTVLNGTTVPTSALGANGDFYINTTSDMIYGPKTAGSWGVGTSLVGPQGPSGTPGATGPQGPQGAAGAVGAQGPPGATGATGAQGVAGPTGATGPQGTPGTNGSNGTDGKTLLNGTTNPASAVGSNGDFYLNTTTSTLFGPKTAGAWPAGVALIGPVGPQGPAGPAGSANAWGITGNTGMVLGTNFIGNTDNAQLEFRVNNERGGFVSPSGTGTSFGHRALMSSTGNNNSGFGKNALMINSTGTANTAMGAFSLQGNTTGSGNSALGSNTLNENTTGTSNTAIGSSALRNNQTRTDNTAVGDSALYSNDDGLPPLSGELPPPTGYYNTATGSKSLRANTSGYMNTANGWRSLALNTTGQLNTAMGASALSLTTTGDENTAVGLEALQSNTTGNANTAIGSGAGPNAGTRSNTTALGAGATCTASNQVRVGNDLVTSIGGYAGWTTLPSDGRFKRAVQEDVHGLDFLMRLRPVTYNVDVAAIDQALRGDRPAKESMLSPEAMAAQVEKASIRYTGFIAQEVDAAAKATDYDFSGVDKDPNGDGMLGLRYAEFVVPLVKAVQEQQAIIERLEKRIAELERR